MTSEPKTALITGAGTGIGRATAERFLREDWQVIAVGRREAPLKELAQIDPNRVLTVCCDLTQANAVDELAKKIANDQKFGTTLSALINNAGAYETKSFEKSDDALWMRMLESNLMSAVRTSRALLGLLKANRGVIVNISSTLGLRPVPATGAYSASKAAMVNWTQCLALELAKFGMRANCICPGIVDTPIHPFHSQPDTEKAKSLENLGPLQPLGRVGKPHEIAHAVWSLCAPGSEWTTGAVVAIDGGISLV